MGRDYSTATYSKFRIQKGTFSRGLVHSPPAKLVRKKLRLSDGEEGVL